MKAVPWLLMALTVVLALLWVRSRPAPDPLVLPTTAAVRDSARQDSIRVDTVIKPVIKYLRAAPVDTLAAILRDRARRPVIVHSDTVVPPVTTDTAQDSGCLGRDVLASTAARQLADSVRIQEDRWQTKIERTRGDSIAVHLAACLDDKSGVTAWGRGFLAGSAAGTVVGLGVCAIIQ